MTRIPKIQQIEGEEEIPAAILAQHIVDLSENFRKALAAGLKAETIVILLQSKTGISKVAIRDILYWLPRLAEEFTTKTKKGQSTNGQ